ncbi:MAG: CsbD family protein [Bryobacteraceae bacterium]
MKSGTQDQLEGKFHEVKGAIKKKAGELVEDPKMQDEGAVEEVAGTIQKKVGQIKKVLEK